MKSRRIAHVTLVRLMYSDMVTTRAALALGSIFWALFLFCSGALFPTPEQIVAGTGRQTYALMAQLAPEAVWAFAFLLHGIFLGASIFVKVPARAALLDAFNGAGLWSTATAACYMAHFQGWSTYQPPAAMGADLAMVLASWWWLVRVWADKLYEASH